MRLKNIDLVIVLLLAAVDVCLSLLPNRPLLVSIVFMVPLVFGIPGYAFAEAIFPKRVVVEADPLIMQPKLKLERPMNNSDRILLSVGLSLALDVIGGFLLNLLPTGLNAQSWAIFLGLTTTVFTLLAAFFRRGRQISKVPVQQPAHSQKLSLPGLFYAVVLGMLALTIVVASVIYATLGAVNQAYPGFTQLWMLPSNQTRQSCAVRLGIRNLEDATTTYRVAMTLNGAPATTWSSVVLVPQQEWDKLAPITPDATNKAYVEVRLYKAGRPETNYQRVDMTLHVTQPAASGGTATCEAA